MRTPPELAPRRLGRFLKTTTVGHLAYTLADLLLLISLITCMYTRIGFLFIRNTVA